MGYTKFFVIKLCLQWPMRNPGRVGQGTGPIPGRGAEERTSQIAPNRPNPRSPGPLDGVWNLYGVVLVVYSGNKEMSSIYTGRHTQELPAKSPRGPSPEIHNLVHGLLDHVQRAWAPEEEGKAWKSDPNSYV